MDDLQPKDRREAIAIFRLGTIGGIARRDLSRGELRTALVALSLLRFRPPDADATRTFSVPTLERWYYAYRKGGLAALMPRPRSDRGHGQELSSDERDLLLDIRAEHRDASVSLILRTLITDGRIDEDAVSAATLRRLYRERGLVRVADDAADGEGTKTRLRWQAATPDALWHGDVCHGAAIEVGGVRQTVRIHALLDDASRYVVAVAVFATEREDDMLALFVAALRRFGCPAVLYLDNGSTYRGEALRTACARLGISLLHARPYDAPARGKMERFWRTLRGGCLTHLGPVGSLAEIEARVRAFVDEHYHVAPHGALFGKSPGEVYGGYRAATPPTAVTEAHLRDALCVRERRRLRKDNTLSVDGRTWECDLGFLAGSIVTVARCLAEPHDPPWIEHDGKPFRLHLVDPIANGKRRRPALRPAPGATSYTPTQSRHFDPAKALLDKSARKRKGA